MEFKNDPVGESLLGRVPQPGDVAAYRESTARLLEKNEKSVARERIATRAFWIFCAASATAWLWFSAEGAQLPRGPFLACIFFVWGGVEVVKQRVRESHMGLLKEIKQLQLQVFELETGPRKGDS
ncbi:MAG TPA: hypothetical protein VGL53_30015 [Bryobacteraceae bacterium]